MYMHALLQGNVHNVQLLQVPFSLLLWSWQSAVHLFPWAQACGRRVIPCECKSVVAAMFQTSRMLSCLFFLYVSTVCVVVCATVHMNMVVGVQLRG